MATVPAMKMFLAFVVGLLLPFAAAFVFVHAGGMPVSTDAPALPLEHYIAHVSIHRAMGRDIDRPSPIPADEANLAAGARVYQNECLVCHGSPDKPAGAVVHMFPPPPPLVRPDKKGVTDDSAGETFWKIRNGIRMTGMPGYHSALSEKEIWQVSLLLQSAHSLPPSVQQILRQ